MHAHPRDDGIVESGFHRGDSDLDGSHNVDRLASKGCSDTCIRAADGFALRTIKLREFGQKFQANGNKLPDK